MSGISHLHAMQLEKKQEIARPLTSLSNHSCSSAQKHAPNIDIASKSGWILPVSLTVVAFITRLWGLESPRVVVFDELFYSRFVQMYTDRIFFFDSNPPLAKQLIAAVAYAWNYGNVTENFTKIGDLYAAESPVWQLRFLPALFGALLVPTSYAVILQLGYSPAVAFVTGLCFLLDNALVTGSRFVTPDSITLCLVLVAFLCVLLFVHQPPFSGRSILYGFLAGIMMGCAISAKYLSFPSLLLFGWIIGRHYWHLIDDLTLGAKTLWKYLGFCWFVLFLIPLAVYMGCFMAHLAVLTKAGPYDSMMSSKFQASLEGGLASISGGQPYNVAYGSQITLRNRAGFQDSACWLHSHKELYPVRYEDGRGSSHQQQVTCYAFKDVNNWWIVKHPNKTLLEVESPPEYVQDGSIVQLVHGITGRLLNSHDVGAPLSPDSQEVSAYIDYNISMSAEDLWQVKIINQEPEDRLWHTIQTEIQLIHVSSTTTLSLSGLQLPQWAFSQFEVVSSVHLSRFTLSLWNVEEHRYGRAHSDDREREVALVQEEFLPDKPVVLSLWKKFVELQWSMLGLSRDTVEEHVYGSKPFDWVLNDNGVAFWAEKGTNKQIYQLGNLVLWHSGASALLLTFLIVSLLGLWRLRYPDIFPFDKTQWTRICCNTEIVVGGFLLNWMPYVFTDRTLFFHHYYPALAFKLILLGSFIGEIAEYTKTSLVLRKTFGAVLGVWLLSAFYTFYRFLPLTYGWSELSAGELHNLEWRESWSFIIR